MPTAGDQAAEGAVLVADGVSDVTVDSASELDVEAVRAAVDEAGYELVG